MKNNPVARLPIILLALSLLAAPAGLVAADAPAGAAPPAPAFQAPATVPALTPAQQVILLDAARRKELTPAARELIKANPELEKALPPEIREKLKAEAQQGMEGERKDEAPRDGKREAAKEPAGAPATPPPYDWRKSVYVSRLFLLRLQPGEAEPLVHFGHEMFDPRPGGALAGDAQPVSEEYLVGPGDEIVVRLYGRLEGTHRLTVDRDGKIFFPKLGPMYVAGKTFRELKTYLRSRIGSIAEVRSDISLGQLKGFQVSVLGEVPAPGRYQVSSFTTVIQAVGAAGGIRDIGSLRRVQVKAGRETTKEVDIYDFLLRGDVTHDIRLRAGETVFVPVAGPLVAVTGEVRRQAIYELRDEKTIADVLAMAGGLSPSAYRRRVQVERLEENTARVVLDLNLDEAGASLATFALRDGDILRVLAVLPVDENVVTVEGNVTRPGKYEWKQGLTVGALASDPKFFLPETFFDYALIVRLVGPEKRKEVVAVNLRRIVVDRDAASDVDLKPMDTLRVFRLADFRERMRASVGGEVRRPGDHEVHPGMRVSDLVKLAGDVTRKASLDEAELSRRDKDNKVTIIKVALAKALAGDEKEDTPLQDGDHLIVRPLPDLQEPIAITLAGEFRAPGLFVARKGERLSSVIRRAGGFTSDAFLKGAVFTRVSVQKRQQELIDRTIEQLEQEVSRAAAREGAAVLDKEDVDAQRQVFEARRTLLARLRQVRAQGRIIIRLAAYDGFAGSEDDLLVEDGDRLEVPRAAEVVNVLGRVYNPTAVVYSRANDSAGFYLRKVGGPTEDADREHIFVVKADGSVVTESQAGQGFFVFGERGIMTARVEPGDSIVVPEKLTYTRLMKDVKDITQILYQIAVTAGVLIVAF